MEQEILPPPSKWEATVTTRLANANADQIWALLRDFFGIYKYFPSLITSYGVQGNNGEVGSIRYCEGSRIPPKGARGNDDPPVSWSKEKIVAIDPIQRWLMYEMIDGNIGFNSYFSNIKVLRDPESGDDGECGGCVIEWSFSVDPVEGLKFEDLAKKYEVGLQMMAQKMEDAVTKF